MFATTLSPSTLIILLALGVLLFGNRLPQMGQWIGKGLREFKKGVGGIEDEINDSLRRSEPAPAQLQAPQRITSAAPRFESNGVPPGTAI
ncbi:MAG: twin-arginine translocase TatA/TatE family subunit [Gemmataceae bacterium]|nr:twin-arginine translocase TatA/TatE family subunit [Gemmataceae bacterium]